MFKKITTALLLMILTSVCVYAQTSTVITAKTFQIDGKTNTVYAEGDVTLTRDDVIITAKKGSYKEKDKEVTLENDVVATQRDLRMTCNKVIFYNKTDLIAAEGNIKVTYQEFLGGSSYATYDIPIRTIKFTGNPWISRGKDRLTSNTISFQLDQKKVIMEGKTKAIFDKKIL